MKMMASAASVLGASVILILVQPAARAGLIAPDVSVAGQSQAQWSVQWWQWAASFQNGTNPVQDTTGALSYLGNQGPVFFLAGTFGSDPVVRAVTVEADQSLFFPLANVVSVAPFNGSTEAELRQDASDTLGVISNLSISLNGTPVSLPPGTSSLLDFRQLSPPGLFDLNLPVNNVFGAPDGDYPAVSDGYWATLGPLAPGTYQLHFTSQSDGTGIYTGNELIQDITYNITSVPEPSSWVLAAIGLTVALGAFLRVRGCAYEAICVRE
jgi:PEP-CTERM motif